MRGLVSAMGDRMLNLLVPRITARAEPCGPLQYKFCYCSGGLKYSQNCCLYSGSCYPCRVSGSC
ncbi:hypothetical protein ACFOW4_19885 [Micromonospora sp. GCM10011542]|uniref:hypothetical protein n=1 Tax=Micromonospora sp. GCM10011542 TaxID=3317337 RepID=UPI00360EE331